MNILIAILAFFVSDCFVLFLFEVLFLAICCYAIKMEKRSGTKLGTIPSKEKWESYYPFAYGVTTLILIQIINSAEAFKGYKVFISFGNLLALTYLTFFNSWFRIKIGEFVEKSQSKIEM